MEKANPKKYCVSIDVGSVSLNCVVVNSKKEIVFEFPYERHFGKIDEETLDLVERLFDLKQLNFGRLKHHLQKIISSGKDLFYQEMKQRQFYSRAAHLIDIEHDHKLNHLDKLFKQEDIFPFDVTSETCLSVAAILQFVKEGYNGVVNVYPFTCMPGMTTSAIIKPVMNRMRIPYLGTPYDASTQPGRETSIRTFMHQATQHSQQYGRI